MTARECKGTLRAMEIALVGFCFVLGLVFASFGNVVIHRVPLGESVVRPPSACPTCGVQVAPFDNIPLLSWLLLRGRCRSCQTPISVQYPLVELTGGLLFAAVGARIGLQWSLPGFLVFTWLLLVIAVIDARTRRIPNALTYPLTPVLVVLLVLAALLEGDPAAALRVVLGGLAAFCALLALALISPRGMGMGDVKLAASIGAALGYLGWGHVLLGLFVGFLYGGLTAIVLLLARRRTRRDLLPFGPYLAAGALTAVLFGGAIIEAYARSTGLA